MSLTKQGLWNTRSYQRTRLYTRIALGKARAMDVVSGESSGNFGQLVLLYPLLFWLQALQANIGVSIMLRGYGALFSPEGWLVGSPPGSASFRSLILILRERRLSP